jgi:hypothetical protein
MAKIEHTNIDSVESLILKISEITLLLYNNIYLLIYVDWLVFQNKLLSIKKLLCKITFILLTSIEML